MREIEDKENEKQRNYKRYESKRCRRQGTGRIEIQMKNRATRVNRMRVGKGEGEKFISFNKNQRNNT